MSLHRSQLGENLTDDELQAMIDEFDTDRDGEISMALPFAARPTGHRVLNGSRSWWANCAWDSLAIPAALHVDAEIEARWLDDDTPVDLRIENGRPGGEASDGFIHFTIPARHWWDDIVET